MSLALDKHFDFDQLPSEDAMVIRKHSRSFSLAARLLPANVREDVETLYAWCRWCDDAVDQAPSVEAARNRLQLLREDVERIYQGEPPSHPASKWLASLVHRYQIPRELPLDLLAGMATDLDDPSLTTVDDLLLYCYQAAGTVGLMMCRIMGVSDPRALPKAKALGMAMQLTNIARDVGEDWQRRRRYLPKQWLSLEPGKDLTPSNEQIRSSVERLLKLADSYYAQGFDGLNALPDKARFAIRLAGSVYREIGNAIRRQECQVMNQRVFVTDGQKYRIAAGCLLAELQFRVKRPMQRMISAVTLAQSPTTLYSNREIKMNNDSRYLFYLGISLTLVMATTLFILVGINPKQIAYDSLPWMYAGGCAVLAAITGAMARRCNRLLTLRSEPAESR